MELRPTKREKISLINAPMDLSINMPRRCAGDFELKSLPAKSWIRHSGILMITRWKKKNNFMQKCVLDHFLASCMYNFYVKQLSVRLTSVIFALANCLNKLKSRENQLPLGKKSLQFL